MTKQEYEQARADSLCRGFSEYEINYRIILRDKYISSLEAENARLQVDKLNEENEILWMALSALGQDFLDNKPNIRIDVDQLLAGYINHATKNYVETHAKFELQMEVAND